MQDAAIKGALTRLAGAKQALASLEQDRAVDFRLATPEDQAGDKLPLTESDFTNANTAWWQFLMAAGGIYSKLEQGAKVNAKSLGWFGRHKNLRKTDPLLQYIHQARNTEEHGLEGSSSFVGMRATKPGPGVSIYHKPSGEIDYIVVPRSGKKGDQVVQLVAPGLRLVPVIDGRSGKRFDPPTSHLGVALSGENEMDIDHPLIIARLAFSYLETMIKEAEELQSV